jgi:hypothetical protein
MPNKPDKTPPVRQTTSVPDAGRILGLGKNASYQAAASGELPTLRFGKKLVVSLAVLEAMLSGKSDMPQRVRPRGAGDADQ